MGSNTRQLLAQEMKRTLGGKPRPIAMAQAMVLFPVPLGPMSMLSAL